MGSKLTSITEQQDMYESKAGRKNETPKKTSVKPSYQDDVEGGALYARRRKIVKKKSGAPQCQPV